MTHQFISRRNAQALLRQEEADAVALQQDFEQMKDPAAWVQKHSGDAALQSKFNRRGSSLDDVLDTILAQQGLTLTEVKAQLEAAQAEAEAKAEAPSPKGGNSRRKGGN